MTNLINKLNDYRFLANFKLNLLLMCKMTPSHPMKAKEQNEQIIFIAESISSWKLVMVTSH